MTCAAKCTRSVSLIATLPAAHRSLTARFHIHVQKLTGVIHNNIETVMLGKCVAAGNRLKMDSMMSAGKAKVREVKKEALTKKTSMGKFQARLVERIEKLKTEGKAHD